MADNPQAGSPEWWLQTLANRMHERRMNPRWSWERRSLDNEIRPPLEHLWAWQVGNPPLPECAEGWHKDLRPMIRMCTVNVAPSVTESIADRLSPLGWRTSVDSDENGDQRAAAIATENQFGVHLGTLWEYMVALGAGYSLIGPAREGSVIPVITVEDPRCAITHENARTGVTEWGLKVSRNDWDTADVAVLAGPDGMVRVYDREGKRSAFGMQRVRINPAEWKLNEKESGFVGDLRSCAMTPFYTPNKRGAFEPHLNIMRRLNDAILNGVSIAKHQAFRQRGIQNLPDKDEHGNTIKYDESAFLSDPGALWRLPAGVEIWESTPTDLNGIRMQNKDILEELAIVTGMPLFYVTPDAANGSAEGATTQRERNTFRIRKHLRSANVGLAETMAKTFAAMGESERADVSTIQTIWEPTEIHSLMDKSQAFNLQRSSGVPFEFAVRDTLGYGPEDLPRLEAARLNDQFFESMEQARRDSAEQARARLTGTVQQAPVVEQQSPPLEITGG